MKNTSRLQTIRNAVLVTALSLASVSCTVVPSGIVAPGQKGAIVQMGGRMELATQTATLKIDNVESFKDGSKLIDNGIKAWGIVASLNRYFDSEDATTAATAATEKAKLSSATEGAKIAADKEIALKTLELEAAEAALPVAAP